MIKKKEIFISFIIEDFSIENRAILQDREVSIGSHQQHTFDPLCHHFIIKKLVKNDSFFKILNNVFQSIFFWAIMHNKKLSLSQYSVFNKFFFISKKKIQEISSFLNVAFFIYSSMLDFNDFANYIIYWLKKVMKWIK